MKYGKIATAGCAAVLCTAAVFCFAGDAVQASAADSVHSISADYAAEDGLFDSSYVHTVNLLISDENWNTTTGQATDEIYVNCDVEIDGERIENVAIRPKGNSSLSSISSQGSTHFSFKIEFDHYDETVTYRGLDKLCLNNLGQDPSCMKDYIAYHLMNDMGVAAPLSSYTILQRNGEDFGLYLAVEAVEDSFCLRNYGENRGQLYKPDCFGIDTLDTSALLEYEEGSSLWTVEQIMDGSYFADTTPGDRTDILGEMLNAVFPGDMTAVAALQYVGGSASDYQALWDTAVFKAKESDKNRMLAAIQTLNCSEEPQSALDVDALLRYFAVHSFVNNYDGYTSIFVHNFYIHEQDGLLSMVPWDYNLGFGTFTYESAVTTVLGEESGFHAIPDTGEAMDVNQSMVNYPIDTPVYSVDMADRPLLNALLTDAGTLEAYHAVYDTLITECFESGKYADMIAEATDYIRPYVAQGLTFYTAEQFEKGANAMALYCKYRAESVRAQLDGKLPATTEGQHADYAALVDPVGLTLSDMADFGALMPMLDDTLISGVLRALLGDRFSYDTAGAVEAVHYYADHPASIVGRIPTLMQVDQIRSMALQKAAPYLVVIAFVITLIVILVILRRQKRRRINDTQA